MIRAEIPQDVTDYKEEFFFGLTLRKLVSVIAVLVIVVPGFIFGGKIIDKSILIYILAVPCVPVVLVGFKDVNGMPFEKYARLIFDFFSKEQRRKFVYLPSYVKCSEEINSALLAGEKILRKEEIRAEKHKKKIEKRANRKERKRKKNAD